MVGIEIPVIIDSKSKSAISQSEEYVLNKNDCYSRNYCIYLFYLFSYLIRMSGPTIATIVLIVLIVITVFALFLYYFLRRRKQRQILQRTETHIHQPVTDKQGQYSIVSTMEKE